MAVEADEFGGARAGNGGFEAGGLRDDEVGGDASVGPAADAELVGVGDSLLNGVIDHGHVVLEVLVAPIGEDGFAEVLAVTGGTARIGKEDGVALGGVKLGKMGEFSVVGPLRAAVGDEKRRVFLARDVIEGFVEVAGDGGAVFAFEVDVIAVGELELGEEGVVDMGDLGELPPGMVKSSSGRSMVAI